MQHLPRQACLIYLSGKHVLQLSKVLHLMQAIAGATEALLVVCMPRSQHDWHIEHAISAPDMGSLQI